MIRMLYAFDPLQLTVTYLEQPSYIRACMINWNTNFKRTNTQVLFCFLAKLLPITPELVNSVVVRRMHRLALALQPSNFSRDYRMGGPLV